MRKGSQYFTRFIDSKLLEWRDDVNKKPLLLRGARQVGKSSAVKKLGETFVHYLEVNFEMDKDVKFFFENSLHPDDICSKLSAYYNVPIIEGKTLLFFDEIQSCIPAISSLRFFYEKKPHLHLIAAGSLLEFALNEVPSYGVGRIRSMFMYPFSFDEFLMALNEISLLEIKRQANSQNPLLLPFYNKLVDYFKTFLMIGGLPEVVKTYVKTRDYLSCSMILNDLLLTYVDDFAKYKDRINTNHLTTVFNAVAKNAGQKFIFSHVSDQMYIQQVKECLSLLEMSGIIIPVTHSAANGIPLGAELKEKNKKYIPFDTGIVFKALSLSFDKFLSNNDFTTVNRGYIAEIFAGLEIQKYQDCHNRVALYYWQREEKSGNAEVDYLIQQKQSILPIEIKSGTKGSMQSLRYFMEKKNITKGLRSSLENFSKYDSIEVIPLFALSNVFVD
jgi:predicted AAA+ superfamily ATPase